MDASEAIVLCDSPGITFASLPRMLVIPTESTAANDEESALAVDFRLSFRTRPALWDGGEESALAVCFEFGFERSAAVFSATALRSIVSS